ncbi:hypothetical protein MNBD_NITROSPINAE02-1614 [hydrothermal vent metagenome]|uniref:Regulatory protein RecX n=1 Tax=hydrothermal vent metagenome TaxID=652676 RepID=A0A3B1BU67_9ZZZZ
MRSVRKKISCIDQAFKLLALRSHSVYEMCEKLKVRDYDSGVIEKTVERLQKLGYLDDEKYSKAYAMARVERMRLGPKRIRTDLTKKGFPREVVSKTVYAIFGEDESEMKTAILAAKKKLRTLKRGLDEGAVKRKLFDHLVRRGFSGDVSRRIALDNIGEISDE